ncbi:MAG: bifunctional DNA-formamidopyrimidine glycosylase/DNA-(apurinic or apyrimidinic site) lyase, partial [Zetaproteobacteria bacterium]|nr:bifunctional DNA-formamidopyrimidine glycosylase/DNA-(apurinic or apyrimidinic site) lyase [Zetaproteobacteria bacterium]
MPELPEVETVRVSLHKHFIGATTDQVSFFRPDLRETIDQTTVKDVLEGQVVEHIRRRGKYLVLSTIKGHVISHLGMSGKMLCLNTAQPLFKHTHYVIAAHHNTRKIYIHYVDPRRFGRLNAWRSNKLEEWEQYPWLAKLGPEPIECTNLAQVLEESGKRSRRAIKTFIMDSSIVVGVGNIYACESLFAAKIHPEREARTLTQTEWSTLATTIREILKRAIHKGGTTLRDYVNSDAEPGYFQIELSVYNRQGQACHTCQ